VALSGFALAVTGVLFWLQAFVIDAWCRFCLVSGAITTLLFLTALVLLRTVRRASPPAGEESS
jgi:uncharacterized membrane protein